MATRRFERQPCAGRSRPRNTSARQLASQTQKLSGVFSSVQGGGKRRAGSFISTRRSELSRLFSLTEGIEIIHSLIVVKRLGGRANDRRCGRCPLIYGRGPRNRLATG